MIPSEATMNTESVLAGTVVLVALLVVSEVHGLDEEMAELAKMLRENCVGESGVDVGLVEQVNQGAELMPDPKLKCYIKCVMETAGWLSAGTVDVEAVAAMLPEEMRSSEPHVRACGTQRGADDCDTAFLTQLCWQRACKPHYFLV